MAQHSTVWDVLALVAITGGVLLSLVAAIGLLRFPDILSRLHTAAKPQVLGLLLILLGVGLRLRTGGDVTTLLLIALFQMSTAPTAAHMLARATYRNVPQARRTLVVDEYRRGYDED